MVKPPQTDEGWYVLHDFRTVDWDAWRDAPKNERERVVRDGVEYLQSHENLDDADEGASAVFSVLGHKADLLVMHLRPTLDALSAAERRFEKSELAAYTRQPTSYVSVTEVSGYVSTEYFEGDPDEVDPGLRNYIEGKLEPDIPDDEYVSFYPMNKRRGETYNWYDLPFEDRKDLMSGHGDIGREYAGKITQIISSSVGFDDYEWGVTLFGADPVDIKNIVYEMRFDPASSRYGEFGRFYVGRRFPPSDLGAFLAGEIVPTGDADSPHAGGESHAESGDRPHGESSHAHGESGGHPHGESATGDHPHGQAGGEGDHPHDGDGDGDIRGELADMDIYAGKPHGEDVYATVLYSEAPLEELVDEVEGLRSNFDHYGTHVKTAVYEARERGRAAVVSIWETESAAETAAGFISELPGVVSRTGEESGFGTMGMFYTVKPDYREEFVEKFETVGGMLDEMDGHQQTDLMVNREDENDMFISSQWRSRSDAMDFFRSEEFSDTVQWGRDVLTDRPRHVFLA
jgi:chlorite dismutase